MYYSRHTVKTLAGILFLAVFLLACALIIITRLNVPIILNVAHTPVASSTPNTEVAYTTPKVPVSVPKEEIPIATSTEKKVETISKPPAEKIVRSTPPTVATVVRAVPSPIKIQSKVIDFNMDEMLNAHNEIRAHKKLSPLTWSATLAQSSQYWADKLTSHGCDFYHDPDSEYGENLFWKWTTDSENTGLISTPRDAVTWWADEERIYNYAKNSCKRGKDCGHYTQIVWADTTEVGCSVSTCFDKNDDNTQTDFWVCRYNPPGNIEGEKPY